jgi:phenylacetate-CoA ligase
VANFYDLEPAEQRRRSADRLIRYLRRYVGPYHPYLRRLYRQAGVDLDKLRTADDLRRLPIIDKSHLHEDPLAFMLQPKFPGISPPEGFDSAPAAKGLLAKYAWQALTDRPRDFGQVCRRDSFRDRVRRRALAEWLPIHFHASTGTTGPPVLAAYTHWELSRLLPQLAGLLALGPKERVAGEPYFDWADRGMNLFPGAPHLAFFGAVLTKMAIGTGTFDACGGHVIPTDRQVTLFAQGRFQSLISVPSYLVHWLRRATALREQGIIGPLGSLKYALVGAEPLSDALRETIRELAVSLGAHPRFKVHETLGMTEMKWWFAECVPRAGIHLNPRFYYWELLHPHTREPVAEGEPGVLVFSHIGWRGTVLVRYWTGDLVKGGLVWRRCEHCGYTFPRVFSPICRAEKDFTKLKGTRVDLSLLVEAVRGTPGVRQFQVSLESEAPELEFSRDVLAIHISAEPGQLAEEVERRLRERVKHHTEVSPDRITFEDDEPRLVERLFAKNGIKAEYIVERRREHI